MYFQGTCQGTGLGSTETQTNTHNLSWPWICRLQPHPVRPHLDLGGGCRLLLLGCHLHPHGLVIVNKHAALPGYPIQHEQG